MATAIVQYIENASTDPSSQQPYIYLDIFFMGADVNGFKKGEIAVNVNGISSLSALATAIATAIRAYATNDGFTVPANSILIPTYQLG